MNKKELVKFIFDMIERKDRKISDDTIIMNKADWNAAKLQIEKELLK